MLSKKDILHIAFRQWSGESLETIAADYDTTTQRLEQLRENLKAEFTQLEADFQAAEIEKLTAGDPIRQIHNGIVLQAYMLVKTRAHMPNAIVEFSQQSEKVEAHLHSTVEAEAILEAFEADFGIQLI